MPTIIKNTVNAFAGGSLNFQTSRKFYRDNSLLIFGLKQLAPFEIPFMAIKNISEDDAILKFTAVCIDIIGKEQKRIELDVNLITISDSFLIIENKALNSSFAKDSIFYFEIETANEMYFSEYFNTSNESINTQYLIDRYDEFIYDKNNEIIWAR